MIVEQWGDQHANISIDLLEYILQVAVMKTKQKFAVAFQPIWSRQG
jgi:hypothetical protein